MEAEHRVEQLSSELGAATSRATEAEAEKRELAQRYSRAHEEVGRMEKRLQALQAEEKARRGVDHRAEAGSARPRECPAG